MAVFDFRDLHPDVFVGTASDRYAGWIGQIYSKGRYKGRIQRRSHAVGGKAFQEEVLPVECVEEYFEHFRVLEIDFTFYRPLLDVRGDRTQNYHTLEAYSHYIPGRDKVLLKVPQAVFARKIRAGTRYVTNPEYLNADPFIRRFYEPALDVLGDRMGGLIFEQEYQRKEDRTSPAELAGSLDRFFGSIPNDGRRHVELRTDAYLTGPVFDVLEKHGVGQVLSHWTWLPGLKRQFALSGGRVFNANRELVLRLLTPRGMRYEDAYARAYPFNELKEDMISPQMIEEAAEIMQMGIDRKARVNVIVNNRAGGNAPLLARRIADRYLAGAERS